MSMKLIKEYSYEKNNIFFKVTLTLSKIFYENFISIECQTSLNNSFSIRKNLQELFIEYTWVQKICHSYDNLFKLIDFLFDLGNVFIIIFFIKD